MNPRANELGIYFCGGRGKHSRRTVLAESTNLPGDSLVRSIRLTAKIDNNVIANVLRGALDRAKIGDTDKIAGFPRLNQFVQAVEKRCETTADFDQLVAHEHSIFTSLNGRSVFDDRNKTRRPARSGKQLSLF